MATVESQSSLRAHALAMAVQAAGGTARGMIRLPGVALAMAEFEAVLATSGGRATITTGPQRQILDLVRVAAPNAGFRWLWRLPEGNCAALFLNGGVWVSRVSAKLVYLSQTKMHPARALKYWASKRNVDTAL